MYIATCKYGTSKSEMNQSSGTLDDEVYIFDTEDCTIEKAKALDLWVHGIKVSNMLFWEGKFTIVEYDFAYYIDLGVNESRTNFTLDVCGIQVSIVITTKGKHLNILHVNGVEILCNYHGFIFAYAFKFRDYAVIRIACPNNDDISWCSVAVCGTDNSVHSWSLDGRLSDSVGTMVDMVSEI